MTAKREYKTRWTGVPVRYVQVVNETGQRFTLKWEALKYGGADMMRVRVTL